MPLYVITDSISPHTIGRVCDRVRRRHAQWSMAQRTAEYLRQHADEPGVGYFTVQMRYRCNSTREMISHLSHCTGTICRVNDKGTFIPYGRKTHVNRTAGESS